MITKNYVRLKILSDILLPEEIDKRVGIKCDESWVINGFRPRTKMKAKENGWLLSSELELSEDLELHIANLLQRLAPAIDKIKSLSEQNTVELSFAIYSEERPALHFDKETIAMLGQLGASLDIDLYIG